MTILFELGLIVGLLAVASNPSPYYAALGLVGSAGVGCLILMDSGVSFLCLVLFLVYLGGMMVVFAYSAALVAEPYPEAWGGGAVWSYIVVYVTLLGAWWVIGGVSEGVAGVDAVGVFVEDWFGVATMFFWGGEMLMMVGWALLLTLFAVLEVVRGHYSGVLRAV
uniref:NADH-ubiquinone oxidoreductase chain 6 n=1 Tax=Strauchbufo raddei TaxID=103435 RepID=A0A0U2Q4R8_9NEOB|nr:NADH dehydrogenase subunit 6 [Strauchbufo raddei]ALL53115.1 NADH dehydrogenase subunit 6 [Strauchbufo raddei]ALP29940.1 NADH dehydrogenase subunit 6 [Strauchbufo raddei]WMW23613.1 NADH dehydrogenase subunit 6 [Strauchbufo raddei]